MKDKEPSEIREAVRRRYGEIANHRTSCGCGPPSCCGGPVAAPDGLSALRVGYSLQDLEIAPEGSDLGLGCGNPQAIAALRPGETVLDLGSGAGFDSFLAARQVGKTGRVIGVDMTPEMLAKARELARGAEHSKIEFRLGEIENLPIADSSVDVIISNCVINLSPDKQRVFQEAFRVLKPGGRLAISDVIATAPLPEAVRNDLSLYSSCIGGAVSADELETMLRESGFESIRIQPKDENRELIRDWAPERNVEDYIASAIIEAVKPNS
ncbi:arsenite methyltransferase [Desulfomonile tiedjei]|uniref:Arsenite methyltransferase n=1 Tax=Desulfomonile tiedjei (strain ATCC 49306 / DSM 6799 / DCB-1) TaxID=706587 RepID=I4C3T5_DESTA|nr:arsenite methyltransferase [Desulfomonile tiedjei]AFM24226.1 methylase involved in ubiquinone/menaquinone biosynthesis [Desulfomonile tiedjei DSM 6799]